MTLIEERAVAIQLCATSREADSGRLCYSCVNNETMFYKTVICCRPCYVLIRCFIHQLINFIFQGIVIIETKNLK